VSDDSFLSRWAKRKAQVKQGVEVAPEAEKPPPVRAEPVEAPPPPASASTSSARTEAPPAPTLDDVAQLTPQSDFRRFVAADVDPSVKNAAMKKLFADPHFNVMDGLDTYIDDYNKFEPIPKSMLHQLVSARALGLVDDELKEQDKPAPDNPVAHEDADLQLQPDDAAGQRVTEPGAGPADDEPDPHYPVPPRGA
jgi:hypothetical protein